MQKKLNKSRLWQGQEQWWAHRLTPRSSTGVRKAGSFVLLPGALGVQVLGCSQHLFQGGLEIGIFHADSARGQSPPQRCTKGPEGLPPHSLLATYQSLAPTHQDTHQKENVIHKMGRDKYLQIMYLKKDQYSENIKKS